MKNKLPFLQRSIDITKNIMVVKDTSNYIVRDKTGWGEQNHKVQMPDTSTNYVNFDLSRIEITYSILNDLKLTKQ